jgi:ABC-2 type transport system permease protein
MLNWLRIKGILVKEFIQLSRDHLTFAMMIVMPLIQLLLFGYSINIDPRNLPAAVYMGEESNFRRSFMKAAENSSYYNMVHITCDQKEAQELFDTGKVSFLISFEPEFTKKLLRNERPQVLVEADAADPGTVGGPISALSHIVQHAWAYDLKKEQVLGQQELVEVVVHKHFNAAGITAYNIVPGLIGAILSMSGAQWKIYSLRQFYL